FYMANSAAVSSVTVNYSTPGGVIKPGIMVMEISGAAVADGSVNGGTAAPTTTSTSGGLLTSNANDLLIFATDASGNESGWTAGTGYAIPNNKVTTGASGSDIRMAMQYAVVNSTQTYTTGMTYTNSNWNGNIFAAFKITSASADPPAVSLSPTSLNFGNQNVGTTSAPQTVTLSNIGTATLSITSIGIENGDYSSDFAETNNCGTSLAAGASCAINVTFTPPG